MQDPLTSQGDRKHLERSFMCLFLSSKREVVVQASIQATMRVGCRRAVLKEVVAAGKILAAW